MLAYTIHVDEIDTLMTTCDDFWTSSDRFREFSGREATCSDINLPLAGQTWTRKTLPRVPIVQDSRQHGC